MIFLLFASFLLTLATMFYDFTSEPIAQAKLDGSILARQIVIQHSAASRACTTQATCPPGPINVTAFMGSYRDKANFGRTNGTFTSSRIGSRIVTWYKLNNAGGARNRQVYGSVSASLAGLGPTANIRYVGYYHDGVIAPGGQVGYRILNPDNTYSLQYYSLPAVAVPGTFDDGTPMVATDLP